MLWTDKHEQMLQLLIHGDYKSIMTTAIDQLKDNQNVTQLYQGYFQPLMYRVGEMWEKGQITVAHEHLATSTLSRIMASLYSDYIMKPVTGDRNRICKCQRIPSARSSYGS